MDVQQNNLIRIIRCVIRKTACEALESPDFSEITRLALAHKLTGFLQASVPFLTALPEENTLRIWRQLSISQAVLEANQKYEYDRLIQAFEKAEITVLPVKGFSLGEAYPDNTLRTMSDIDFLIEEKRAEDVCYEMTKLGYRTESFGESDTDQYFSETGIHVEIHRNLFEDRMPLPTNSYLSTILSRSVSVPGYHYVRKLTHEDQYIYLMLHTLKHFVFAGTGIRSVLDIFLFRRFTLDQEYLEKNWSDFSIHPFVKSFEKLSDVWFAESQQDELSQRLGSYIVNGGVYGSEENKMHSIMRKNGNGTKKGKIRYVLRRFFLPYRAMSIQYPILKKLPFLLPFYWIYRAVYALLVRRGKLFDEFQSLEQYDPYKTDAISSLMNDLQLI